MTTFDLLGTRHTILSKWHGRFDGRLFTIIKIFPLPPHSYYTTEDNGQSWRPLNDPHHWTESELDRHFTRTDFPLR